MRPSYDIIVVGAGPAGSMAARRAALGGATVLLLEKDPSVGIPVLCAEAISTEGLTRFFPKNELKPQWLCTTIEGVTVQSPSGRSLRVNHPAAGYVLERKIFDRDLALLAVSAGAELQVSTSAVQLVYEQGKLAAVEMKKDGQTFQVAAKLVIGADGVESIIGRQAGLCQALPLDDIYSNVQYTLAGITCDPHYPEFWVGQNVAPGGYFWVFPKGDGWANVGLGLTPALTGKRPKQYLDEIIQKRYPNASVVEYISGAVPSRPLKKMSGSQVLLCGDSARLADPSSGGGIASALWSGDLAGQAAAEAVRRNDLGDQSLQSYDQAWNKAYGSELRLRLAVKQIYSRLDDQQMEELFDVMRDLLEGKTVTAIDSRELMLAAVKHSPKLLKWGLNEVLKNFGWKI